jgi:hypothetical protein
MATYEPKTETKAGRPNIQKLLKPTKFHPKGRIKIDPTTGEPVNTKNNVIGTHTKVIRHESGIEIGRVEIPVNGGHAKAEGSVWRIALGGPKKYHQKVLADRERLLLYGKSEKSAPHLELEEMQEYRMYEKFLKETSQEIAENEEFYKWFKKAKKTDSEA